MFLPRRMSTKSGLVNEKIEERQTASRRHLEIEAGLFLSEMQLLPHIRNLISFLLIRSFMVTVVLQKTPETFSGKWAQVSQDRPSPHADQNLLFALVLLRKF